MKHRHLQDDPDDLREAIQEALTDADMLLLTGGVSRGDWDFIPGLLEASGVERGFHRVAQKPGKPLWFGMHGMTAVFGLPGNPNSALICARMYVVPALMRWRGGTMPPALRGTVAGLPPPLEELTHFVPLRLDEYGGWRAAPPATSGSLHALSGTRALAELSPDTEGDVHIHTWRPI